MKVPDLFEIFWNLLEYFFEPSNKTLKIIFFAWRMMVLVFTAMITAASFWYEWTQIFGLDA